MLENKRNLGTHPTVAVIVRNFGNNSYFNLDIFNVSVRKNINQLIRHKRRTRR